MEPRDPPDVSAVEKAVRRFRRTAGAYSTLARGLRYLALWGFAWGVAVLVLRAGFRVPAPPLLWGLAGAVPALLLAAFDAWRRRPRPAAVRALLDARSRAGGLWMAAGDGTVDLGGWRGRLPASSATPRLRWRGGRSGGLLAGAVLFVVAAFAVPTTAPGIAAERPLELGAETAEVAERLAVLEEEGVIDPESAERLGEELRALISEASGDAPARAWESLDQLREATARAASEAAEAALAESERLAAAEAVAEAIRQERARADAGLVAAATEELRGLAGGAASSSGALDPDLAQRLAAGEKGSGEELGELLRTLGEGREEIRAQLERLRQAGLVDGETLRRAERNLEAGDRALEEYLRQRNLEASLGVCQLADRPGPGRGGVTRGPGAAPLGLDGTTYAGGAEFQTERLESSSLAGLGGSTPIGTTVADPTAPSAAPSAGSALDPSAVSGGGAAVTGPVLPRHRGAVRRFFDRPGVGEPRSDPGGPER